VSKPPDNKNSEPPKYPPLASSDADQQFVASVATALILLAEELAKSERIRTIKDKEP
jgi:hypothetical protein